MIRASLASLASLFRSRSDPRERRSSPTARGSSGPEAAPQNADARSTLLGRSSPFLAEMRDALILVKPETVVRWHRLGFRAYWTWKSKKRRPGRPRIDPELRKIIRRMANENPTWGAPRVHAELRLLGFDVAERTVLRYLPKPANPDAVRRWMVFLRQHRKALVGMDFFVVNTLTFRLLHVLFIIHHDRRRIVH